MDSLTDAIDQLIHDADLAAPPPWDRPVPLHFTARYADPADLDAARERWVFEHGNLGSVNKSHMWHRALTGGRLALKEHSLDTFTVDLRCPVNAHAHRDEPCGYVGDLLYLAVCAPCQWHAIGDENDVVDSWHDHAFPGWRTLPVLPEKLRGKMGTTTMTPKLQDWFNANYPVRFRAPGAPIRTTRSPYGTRHVPNYSPYGGYDLAANHTPEPDS